MITEQNISLLDAQVEAIGQCCNCQCVMGAGVAKAIKERFPEVYTTDLSTRDIKITDKLGTFSLTKIIDNTQPIRFCFNFYAQLTYGRNMRQVDYEALYNCLEKMMTHATKLELKTVGFPKGMASTLAGGDFRIVRAMIEVVFENSGIDVIICNYQK